MTHTHTTPLVPLYRLYCSGPKGCPVESAHMPSPAPVPWPDVCEVWDTAQAALTSRSKAGLWSPTYTVKLIEWGTPRNQRSGDGPLTERYRYDGNNGILLDIPSRAWEDAPMNNPQIHPTHTHRRRLSSVELLKRVHAVQIAVDATRLSTDDPATARRDIYAQLEALADDIAYGVEDSRGTDS